MSGFTKPGKIASDLKVNVLTKLGRNVPADPRKAYTDRMEFLSPGLLIGYKNRPSDAERTACIGAYEMAKQVLREANDQLAKVVILRRSEDAVFSDVMEAHFGLIEGDDAGGFLTDNTRNRKFSLKRIGKHDRRWVLEKIRRKICHLSFHMHTGTYLIDIDAANRDIQVGSSVAAGSVSANTEGYVGHPKVGFDANTWKANAWYPGAAPAISFYKNGYIHISFSALRAYSPLSYARVIIHEATHRFLGTRDVYYAHDGNYQTLHLTDALENADSFAWAAISLYCGAVKMGDASDLSDWTNCSKP